MNAGLYFNLFWIVVYTFIVYFMIRTMIKYPSTPESPNWFGILVVVVTLAVQVWHVANVYGLYLTY